MLYCTVAIVVVCHEGQSATLYCTVAISVVCHEGQLIVQIFKNWTEESRKKLIKTPVNGEKCSVRVVYQLG